MSDLASAILSGGTSSTASTSQSQSDLLVQAYKNTRQGEIDILNQKKTTLQNRQKFFLNLRTKIDSLVSNLDTFKSDNANSKFVTRSVTSSDTSVMTASANADANLGVNSVKVLRLATNDNLISDKVTLAGATSLTPGVYNFTISGKNGSVTLTADDTTNEKVMNKLVNAINQTTDITVNASFIKIDSTSGKMTLSSKTTGNSNDIQFSDSSILTAFGITNAAVNPHSATRTVATDNLAGYMETDYSNLDAKLNFNGVNIFRESNTVSDAISGVTLNLLKPQAVTDQAVTLTANINRAAVESLIQPLLGSYNDLITFLNQDPSVLRSDAAISGLTSKIRGLVSQPVNSISDPNPKFIAALGIKTSANGTLSFSDSTKLDALLKDDPQKVANLFTASDGFVAKLNDAIANLGGSSGLIVSRNKSLLSQIDSTTKHTADLQARIDKSADIMRKEYESMLQVYTQAQSQYNLLGAFQTTSSGY